MRTPKIDTFWVLDKQWAAVAAISFPFLSIEFLIGVSYVPGTVWAASWGDSHENNHLQSRLTGLKGWE